ncbi:MAG: FliA/WhiG family RNA polymerase sigma factor [Bacillaceae bacterium]|nr:FliA/WhiG family RNA polymerase sigma factor [Bacillaceae bacterium]
MKDSAPQVQKLWTKWKKYRDQEAGNELVKHYMPLVQYHVHRISAHLPNNVNKQEITSLGFMGLVDAIEKFDLKRDLKFDTYASFRIRGAIMDGLRKEDWLPRSIRDKTKKIESIVEKLEQQLNRSPSAKEIAVEADMEEQEVEEIIKDSLFANVLSIEEKNDDQEDNKSEALGYVIPDEKAELPEEHILKQENIKELARAIQTLNEKEQMVVSLFYKEELTLTEIGNVMNLSTSRISQIHSRAIFKLKKLLTSK